MKYPDDDLNSIGPAHEMLRDLPPIKEQVRRMIAAAIAAEREACAKVAETLEAGNGRLREAAELTGYINGLTWAGNLKSRYHINDDTGKVINDLRQQIDNKIAALDGTEGLEGSDTRRSSG
jgi:hypothetical protein